MVKWEFLKEASFKKKKARRQRKLKPKTIQNPFLFKIFKRRLLSESLFSQQAKT